MTVTIVPRPLAGRVTAPPSKSMGHRALIAAALSDGVSRISGIAASEDILATIDCLRALGASIEISGDVATVRGFDVRTARPTAPLPCRESGSTLRFLLPLCWLSGNGARLVGSERLLARPLSVYREIAEARGLTFSLSDGGLSVGGRLTGGEYAVRGDVSSQFITGLLFALPLTEEGGTLRLLPPVESRSYIDLTLEMLSRFGAPVRAEGEVLYAEPVRALTPCEVTVEGDYSNAAFFEALRVLGHDVEVTGLAPDSRQGDRVYREYFAALGAGTPTLSLADCPDLGPILMAVAAAKNGAVFLDTARLSIKESDRGAAMAEELSKLGTRVTVEKNRITVEGGTLSSPRAPLCGHNDHRIVMALATLATLVGGCIEGAEAVKKSLPEYFEILTQLGAEVTYEAK